MPAIVLDDTTSTVKMEDLKSEKKHKRSKSDHKKRPREEDEGATPRHHKKSKKHQDNQPPAEDHHAVKQEGSVNGDTKKKSKKHRKSKDASNGEDVKTEKERQEAADDGPEPMDVDAVQPTTATATSDASPDTIFPFYTQTISLYVPFFPIGFDKPITNVASQHLEPLLNHYSPLLRGVLLAYRNINLSERPVRPNPKNLPDDHTPALLESLDEYAVGFGWLTADVDLFIPSRGAWMEGTVNLQSEGHIGVVCWNKFNASIEAKRLPAGWRWVELNENGDNKNANGKAQAKHTFFSADPDTPDADPENEGTDILDDSPLELAELHTTGYWVDESGARVSATPLRFRIKNFDVGVAGDYGYISIEGTTLNDEEERAMGRQERELERRRREKQNPGGLLRPMLRRVPEFSLTSFGKEEQEEDSIKKTVLYQGSRPGTPDD
ncbi:hypothetical protein BR93DRAFT_454 [Coniochaeta sp. PMI_546]|nr:hypothetical protein BR93DRAFT_454 [Coniochaeta sp. PMI_546]